MKAGTESRVVILGTGVATPSDHSERSKSPANRKATRNMILALAATERALAAAEERSAAVPFPIDDRTALVFGSSYGEIETTKDFLVTLADLGMARPLLFQNSLHNSTTGFLTLRLKLTGPAITISSESVTGEESFNTALTLLRSGVADRAIVTVTDSIPADLLPAFRALRGVEPGGPFEFGDGSASVVLALERDAAAGIAYVSGKFETTPGHSGDKIRDSDDRFSESYESDGLHAFVRALGKERNGTEAHARVLIRDRRDGGRSLLRWDFA